MEQGLQKSSAQKLAESVFGEDYRKCDTAGCFLKADVPVEEYGYCQDHALELEGRYLTLEN